MNPTPANDKRAEQHQQAAQSNLKTPATETAHAAAAEVHCAERDSASAGDGASGPASGPLTQAQAEAAQNVDQANRVQRKQPLPPITAAVVDGQTRGQTQTQTQGQGQTQTQTRTGGASQAGAALSTDVRNAGGPDSTLDTDGKSVQAAANRPQHFPNVVSSSASPHGSVPTDPQGLAGFDSRAQGSLPPIAASHAYRVEHAGTVDELPVWRSKPEIAQSGLDDFSHINGARVAHVVHIVPTEAAEAGAAAQGEPRPAGAGATPIAHQRGNAGTDAPVPAAAGADAAAANPQHGSTGSELL
jgi:hypothetical protein